MGIVAAIIFMNKDGRIHSPNDPLQRIVNLANRSKSCLVPTFSNFTVAFASIPDPARAITSPRPNLECSIRLPTTKIPEGVWVDDTSGCEAAVVLCSENVGGGVLGFAADRELKGTDVDPAAKGVSDVKGDPDSKGLRASKRGMGLRRRSPPDCWTSR